MDPALSVIFFTVLSGMGYGLMAWAGVGALSGASSRAVIAALAIGALSATVGLLSSLGHLGKPGRAWRAFSQWRTSWLSREGVAAVLTFVPAVAVGMSQLPGMLASRSAGEVVPLNAFGVAASVLLIVGALVTVACTAMIYASLKPIPAWRHRAVVPVYVLFSLLTGGLVFATLQSWGARMQPGTVPAALAAIALLAVLKLRYWRDLRRHPLPVTRGSAVGLPEREVTVFERPHTEGNFVTREMVFVLARRHADRLRRIAFVLFAAAPALLLLPASGLVQMDATAWLAAASLCAIAGAFVERWLFFAEARHLVSLYY